MKYISLDSINDCLTTFAGFLIILIAVSIGLSSVSFIWFLITFFVGDEALHELFKSLSILYLIVIGVSVNWLAIVAITKDMINKPKFETDPDIR